MLYTQNSLASRCETRRPSKSHLLLVLFQFSPVLCPVPVPPVPCPIPVLTCSLSCSSSHLFLVLFQFSPAPCPVPVLTCTLSCSSSHLFLVLFQFSFVPCPVPVLTCSLSCSSSTSLRWISASMDWFSCSTMGRRRLSMLNLFIRCGKLTPASF